jgi:hypothetical protein
MNKQEKVNGLGCLVDTQSKRIMPRKNLLNKQCAECGVFFEIKHLHQETCSRKCGTFLMRKRELEKSERDGISQAWACGGGVQSTAIAALICLGKLPKPDFAWIVDVGYEKSRTFDYISSVIIPKLSGVGVELNIIKAVDYLDNSLFDRTNNVKLPLYEKTTDGIVRKYKTHCSGYWKQTVAHRWLRGKGVNRCDTWLGISVDERRRIKVGPRKWNQNKYPLINLGLRREDCIDLIARMGWPKPEQTSCYLCPNQSDYQWQDTKQHYPEDWEKAIAAEEYIRSVKSNLFLHVSCQPLKEKKFDTNYIGGLFVGKECFGDCYPNRGGGEFFGDQCSLTARVHLLSQNEGVSWGNLAIFK